jgi:putative transposase
VKPHPEVSLRRQCELLGVNRSSLDYVAKGESELNLAVMRMIDETHTKMPFYGRRRMREHLFRQGIDVNVKRVGRLMNAMGIETIYPRRNLSKPNPEHRVFPYLLRGVRIDRQDHVWSTDITYIRMRHGFMYLMAIMDWYSRYVLAWRLSNTLETDFCLEALEEALTGDRMPDIFNTDQGSQFTSKAFTDRLLKEGIQVSMDGRGRAFDNIFTERLWRTVKYEEVYLFDYEDGFEAAEGLGRYFLFYNQQRPHQSLQYRTPAEVYFNVNSLRQTIQ